ncbi:hypothetical protein EMCRGX_G005445 [Ephydatia muelleri]
MAELATNVPASTPLIAPASLRMPHTPGEGVEQPSTPSQDDMVISNDHLSDPPPSVFCSLINAPPFFPEMPAIVESPPPTPPSSPGPPPLQARIPGPVSRIAIDVEDVDGTLRLPFHDELLPFAGRLLGEFENGTSPPPPPPADQQRDPPPGHRASGWRRYAAISAKIQRFYRANPSACVRQILSDGPPLYCKVDEGEIVAHFSTAYAASPPLNPTPEWLFPPRETEDVNRGDVFPGSTWCRKLDTTLRGAFKQGLKLPRRTATQYFYLPQALGGLGIPSAEDEAHIARAAQAFKFLGDTRDSVIREVALQQLSETVTKRARRLDPNKLEDLAEFLNTSAAPGEGHAGDLQSLWSSARASLVAGGAAIKITQDSAILHTSKHNIPWHKRKQAFQAMEEAGQRHLRNIKRSSDQASPQYTVPPQWKRPGNPRTHPQSLPSKPGDGAGQTQLGTRVNSSPTALEDAARLKVDKYEPLQQTLLQSYTSVEVLPFIVGSLGSWYPPNDRVLSRLHIGWKYANLMRRLCVVSAIAGSQSIWYKSMCTQRRVPLSADGPDVVGDGPVVVDGPADVCADPVVIDAGPVVVNGSPVVVESGAVTIKCYDQVDNTAPTNGEGRRGDLSSLWSSVRVSLQTTAASISITNNSAVLTSAKQSLGWSKRKMASQSLKAALANQRLLRLQSHLDQGRAFHSISQHPDSSFFTYSGAFISFYQYRFIHKARLDLLPVRTVQARCRKRVPSIQCRVCNRSPETLAHVLNHCLPSMDMIRDRHNSIVDRIVRAIPQHLGKVFKEQPMPGTTGDNRPDLTIISPDNTSAILLDVTCPFEGSPEALMEAARHKVEKYEPLRQSLLQQYQSVTVYPFVVGSLGSWFPANDTVLSALRIGFRYARLMRKLCVLSAISGSQAIWYKNMCSHRHSK